MRFFAILLLVAPLYADVVGNFEVYIGKVSDNREEGVVVSLVEGKLIPSYGPTVLKEIKETFNLETLDMISAPRIQTPINEEAMVRTSYSNSGPVKEFEMRFKVNSLDSGMAHVYLDYAVNGGESSGAEFATPLKKPVTLASRIDHHLLFIICSIESEKKYSLKERILPRVIKKVNPAYPEEMRKEGISDVVVLSVTVGVNGRTEKVKVLRGDHELSRDAAIAAVKQWEWEPALEGGEPVEMDYTVTLKFRLK